MAIRIIKSIGKFLIGLTVGLFSFSIFIKGDGFLKAFSTNGYLVHIYTIFIFIVSGLFAIDFKNIKNDLKTIYKSCNDFDKRIFSRFEKPKN